MLKKLLLITSLVTASALVVLVQMKNMSSTPRNLLYFSYCEKPIKYSLGSIDGHFNLTENQLKLAAQKASDIWNTAYGKPLFVFDSTGELDINVVYDGRQSALVEISTLESDVDTKKNSLEAQLEKHARTIDALEKKISELNEEIQYWNSQGGAPEEEYDRLKRERDRLNAEIESVNKQAQKLNSQAQTLNKSITSLNNDIENFNESLEVHPEEGSYTSGTERIEIYLYDSENTLVHTLAHEFGHAIGLSHTSGTTDIMYSVASPSTALSTSDIDALLARCAERNRINELVNTIKLFYKDMQVL